MRFQARMLRLACALSFCGGVPLVASAQELVRPAERERLPAAGTSAVEGTPVGGGSPGAASDPDVFEEPPMALRYSPTMLVVEIDDGPFTSVPSAGGGAVQVYDLLGPPLPAGLVFDPSTGIVSGRPEVLHPATMHTIEASNGAGSTSFDLLIEVTLPPPPGDLTYGDAPPGTFSFNGETVPPMMPMVIGRVDSFAVDPALPNAFLSVSGGVTLARTGVLLPENVTPIPFTPPEQTLTHPWEVVNVWLPSGTPPDSGWPVLLSNPNAGYYGAPPRDELDPADPIELLYHKAVNAGFAVVFAGSIDSGPVTGWFVPPGHPSGRWEDPDELMAEKDFLHALQWVKEQSAYDLDTDRIFLHGASAGATLAAWIGLGGELASGASPQSSQSSRVAGVLCFDTLTSFLAYDADDATLAHHWESVTSPGSNATSMGDADPAILDANSVARVLLDPTCNGATTPVFLAYEDDIGSIDYSNDADQFPALRDRIGANVHDLWHGAKLWERLRFLNAPFHDARSEFHVGNGMEGQLGSMVGAATGTYTGSVLDSAELYDQAIAWMVVRSRETIPDPSGLRLHPKSGTIYGTPNVSARQRTYTVTAENPGGVTSEDLRIRVKLPGTGNR